jgi:hypothetical protein
MPYTFQGGEPVPPYGTPEYDQAQQGSGNASYDPNSGTLYDPTGGTDYPTSPWQIAAAQQNGQYGEFPTYSTFMGFNRPSYWGANLGFDVRSISPTPTINYPQQNPTVGGINGVEGQNSYFKAYDEEQKKRMKQAQDQAMALMSSEKVGQQQSLLQKLLSGPSQQQTLQSAMAQSGIAQYQSDISSRTAEINTLTEQYNKTVAARDQQIAKTQDKYASTNFISNQSAQINRNAAPELNRISADINAKAAQLQVSQGQVQNAQKYIAQMVDAVTADYKDTYDMYRQLQSENETVYNNLRSDYKEAYTAQMNNAKDTWQYAREEATKVGSLMLDNPQAGIDPHDTLEEALTKVQRTPKATKPDIFGGQTTGYGQQVYNPKTNKWEVQSVPSMQVPGSNSLVKLSNTQINNGSSRAGITPDEFKKLDPQIQTYFSGSGGTAFTSMIASINAGKATYEDGIQAIEASVQPPQVKEYMKTLLEKALPQTEEKDDGRGFWSKLGSWFGGYGYK